MNNAKVVMLGFALGLTGALAPSCGPSVTCNASTCANGCCNAAGKCESPSTSACGLSGSVCKSCNFGQACQLGACITSGNGGSGQSGGGTASTGGGDVGGGTGVTGGGTAVTGGGMVASGGGSATTGGGSTATGGGSATTGGGSTATGGGSATTGGGSTATGGGSATTGGGSATTGGGSAATGGGSAATGGGSAATGGGTATCAGCLFGGVTCVLPPNNASNSACGTNGAACNNCANAGQVCSNFVCVTQGTGGGTATGGGSASTGGGATGGGTALGDVGAACSSSPQCLGGLTCKQVSGNITYSQGMCTKVCVGDVAGECGANGACVGGAGSVVDYAGEPDSVCVPTCAVPGGQSTCRANYTCFGDPAMPPGVCFPNSFSTATYFGAPANKLGNPCTTDIQCGSPPNPNFAFCFAPRLADGGATLPDGGQRFQDGYCSAQCFDNTICGSTNPCLTFNQGTANEFNGCLRSCAQPGTRSSCRNPGYTCQATEADGGGGVCFPDCSRGGTCPVGKSCSLVTGACQ